MQISRRSFLQLAAAALAAGLSDPLRATGMGFAADPDSARLKRWVAALRSGPVPPGERPFGEVVARAAELAIGSPYRAGMLEEYLREGGDPSDEPLTLTLRSFDCVTLVESSMALARLALRDGAPEWEDFAREMERMRYRGGVRAGYPSRLHYFSDWIQDNESRGLVQQIGRGLGGIPDRRPLRFMTDNRERYPALVDDEAFGALERIERQLDSRMRWVVPATRIALVSSQLRTGDVLAFATTLSGLDVTHTGLAYRDEEGVLRVLHAPLSGGVVEISRRTLPEYVAAIRGASGILVARPLPG